MKLIGFSGTKIGTKATLTHIDANNKLAHFVIGDAHAEYKFEGEPVAAKLLEQVVISEEGLVSLSGKASPAKEAVKKTAPATGQSSSYNKHY